MKTLCVAVVVLSLSSACRPTQLACDRLLKPVDTSPDLSGRWFIIAMSSEVCLIPALLNSLLWPSVSVDFTARATTNIYEATTVFKIYDYCREKHESVFFQHNYMFVVDSSNIPTGTAIVLLQTGCPDCLALKRRDTSDTLLLLSRRPTVTEAELKEFKNRAECLDWSEPQVLNTDHDYKNCKTIDDKVDFTALWNNVYHRLKNTYSEPMNCITKVICGYLEAFYVFIQGL